MAEHPDINALMASRICHDLISPIGAIGNGVELLMMENGRSGPEMALIGESVASANARIRFFRVAYGLASTDQRMARSEITAILNDVTSGTRLTVDWQLPGDLFRREAKLLFLAIQCLETAMAFGGRLTVASEGNRWIVTGQAPRLKIAPEVWDHLSKPQATAEITPALVQFALFPQHLRSMSRRLSIELRDTEIRLQF